MDRNRATNVNRMPVTIDEGRTVSINIDDDRTIAMDNTDNDCTVSYAYSETQDPDDQRTIGLYNKPEMKYTGYEPIVGWLVCTAGPEKGRDYRLHAGRNFIGRYASMDISIFDDCKISRNNHLSVVYDPKGNDFLVIPGKGLTELNGKALIYGTRVYEDDKISLGDTELVLIPYCREGRIWTE